MMKIMFITTKGDIIEVECKSVLDGLKQVCTTTKLKRSDIKYVRGSRIKR